MARKKVVRPNVDKMPRNTDGWKLDVRERIKTSQAGWCFVSVATDSAGRKYLDIRKWFAMKGEDTMKPSRKGLTLPFSEPSTREIIVKAFVTMNEVQG